MITKERIKKLADLEKTIYEVKYYNINPVNLEPGIKIYKDCIKVPARLEGRYGVHKYYKNLFETFEEAQEYLDYGDISRTETLTIPTYEQYKKNPIFNFYSFDHKIVNVYGDKKIVICKDSLVIFSEKLNEENYTKVRKQCKELFLGECYD